MAVFKENKSWTAFIRYKNWKGDTCQKRKKGFKTKHEAQEYEREFLLQAEKDMDMTFEQFFELYSKDNQHNIRPHTWIKKEYMVKKHVMPYFGKSVISKIRMNIRS